MNCQETRRWLAAHLDGELDLALDAEVAAHLQTCADCAALAQQQTAFCAAVREQTPRFVPPPHLATRIRAGLRAERSEATARPTWWRIAGALAAAAMALAVGVVWGERQERSTQLGKELIASHVLALTTGHLTEIASSDRHTVKPWLAEHLDFSPPVADLAEEGFPLAGARAERLGGQEVAALVYHRQKHAITVFVWPADMDLNVPQTTQRGYHMRTWHMADWKFAAVSDIPEVELEAFAAKLASALR